MTDAPLGKPLFALLLASAVLSLITVLTPVEEGTDNEASDLLPERRPAHVRVETPSLPAVSWVRPATVAYTVPTPAPATPATPSLPLFIPPPVTTPEWTPPVDSKPPVPPLAFSYLGRLDGDKTTVFLAQGDDSRAVSVGDVLDQHWRVESISDTAVKFRYLPSNDLQQLVIGEH